MVNTAGGASVKEDNAKTSMIFDQIYIMLENDEIISLKDDTPSDFLYKTSIIWSYKQFTIEDDSTWQKLKTLPIKKIRISMKDKELGTSEIDKNGSNAIINAINCVDSLGIPKSK